MTQSAHTRPCGNCRTWRGLQPASRLCHEQPECHEHELSGPVTSYWCGAPFASQMGEAQGNWSSVPDSSLSPIPSPPVFQLSLFSPWSSADVFATTFQSHVFWVQCPLSSTINLHAACTPEPLCFPQPSQIPAARAICRDSQRAHLTWLPLSFSSFGARGIASEICHL